MSLDTPSYVFDTDILTDACQVDRGYDPPGEAVFCHEGKPVSGESIGRICGEVRSVFSRRIHICVQNGLDMKKIVLSGVNKEYEDVRYAMEQGVVHYTAESRGQFYLVSRCAEELDRHVEILLRVTSGNQFGMSEEDVRHLIGERDKYPYVNIRGLQYFTGTQKKVIKKIAAEVEI